jgi:hypothetical protein
MYTGIAGFFLSHWMPGHTMTYRQKNGTSGGIEKLGQRRYRQGGCMGLTDTFLRAVKHSAAPAGDKHTDGGAMYLLVKASGK